MLGFVCFKKAWVNVFEVNQELYKCWDYRFFSYSEHIFFLPKEMQTQFKGTLCKLDEFAWWANHFHFKKTGRQSYKKFSVESLELKPFGSELCNECLVGKCQVSGSQCVRIGLLGVDDFMFNWGSRSAETTCYTWWAARVKKTPGNHFSDLVSTAVPLIALWIPWDHKRTRAVLAGAR